MTQLQQLPAMNVIAETVFQQIQQLPQTPTDNPQVCPLQTEVEGTLMMPLEFLEQTALEFQMIWLAGSVPEGLIAGKLTKPVNASVLEAAMNQPGISEARRRMLNRLYEGMMASEIVAQDTETPEIDPMPTVPRKTRASEQPEEQVQVFLEQLLKHLRNGWLRDPLLIGALQDLIDRKPAYLMTLMEDQNDPQKLAMAPFLVVLAVLEALMAMQEGVIYDRMCRRMAPKLRAMTDQERIQTRTALRSEAAQTLGESIGSALQTSHPIKALKDLNPLAVTWNLSSAHLPSV